MQLRRYVTSLLKRVHKVRERHFFSWKEIAEKADVSYYTIVRLQSGSHKFHPTIETLAKLNAFVIAHSVTRKTKGDKKNKKEEEMNPEALPQGSPSIGE